MKSPPIERLSVSVYTIATDSPESDGTLQWDSTTMIAVEARAGGVVGTGWTYSHAACGKLIEDTLAQIVCGRGAFDVEGAWWAMLEAVRNLGREGLAACAISAVDVALWDLKARLLGVALVSLLGQVRESALVYGSGGFTSYDTARLQTQLGDWVEREGLRMVKMKVGREPRDDLRRVAAAREAIGDEALLMVDANGAYSRKQALHFARAFHERCGVCWFEEPVSQDDLEGLRLVRDETGYGLSIASGEYGWDLWRFRELLLAGAADVLQPDVTRVGGITGFTKVAALCQAFNVPISAHTAPEISLHVCCATRNAVHLEYFHDHVRIAQLLGLGLPALEDGRLRPDTRLPGHGLRIDPKAARRFTI